MVVSKGLGLQHHEALSLSSPIPVVPGDDLSREVFGVMGIPLDALDLSTLLRILKVKVHERSPFLLSTPNVNFLMLSRADEQFRESLLMSDLCAVDGMPLVWISRLLGIPIRTRLSGSDIFDALRSRQRTGLRLRIFLFGGGEGAAEIVSRNLNLEADGMSCVGTLNPGFGTIEEMSTDPILRTINSSGADLLSVFLSARKAQSWLLYNHARLQVPVRVQLGATINLQAGSIKRAPPIFRRFGLEWAWRIKEEPYLWRRYWNDGGKLLALLLTCVLPLSINHLLRRLVIPFSHNQLSVDASEDQEMVCVKLMGSATSQHVDLAISGFRKALYANKDVCVDVSDARFVDARFFGLFLMLRKQLKGRERNLHFRGVTPKIARMFRLNGFEFLVGSRN